MGNTTTSSRTAYTPNENAITPVSIIDEEVLRGKIYVIRGQKVMLDFELAEIYGYSTTAFNQQVKRNIEKFDADFMFRLTRSEFDNLMSQIVTSSRGGHRKLPHAFTEQGIYMLMTVLRGELATRQSKALIRLFKRLKDTTMKNQGLLGHREFLQLSMQVSESFMQVARLRNELTDVESDVAKVVDSMGDFVRESEIHDIMRQFGEEVARRGYYLMDGHPFEGDVAYSEIYDLARKSVFVIDNYIGPKTLMLLKGVRSGVRCIVFTDNKGRGLHATELADFQSEYPDATVELRCSGGNIHDRYIVIDYDTPEERIFHCGASSKDVGVRATTITEVGDAKIYHPMIESLLERPALTLT